MSHPLTHPVHRFHIPVMGTGFTIDTPLKVARYGISSVVSLVDDVLIEQMRRRHAQAVGADYVEIGNREEDARAKRITAYLDLLDEMVTAQVDRLKQAAFTAGSELTHYFEMLPESPLRALYEKMQATTDPAERQRLQHELRERIVPGGIDVNIMTKLDRIQLRKGMPLGPQFSDALSALRGYANSRLHSSVVLSAGMNRRLFAYLREFPDFLPDEAAQIRKRIILKVSDYRSALIQGKLLAKQGLWVSEFRVESGLNCGGHAFGGNGHLLGPILEEFGREREKLAVQLHGIWKKGLESFGHSVPDEMPETRVTVQGGIGTAEENEMLVKQYKVDGMGWGSPFLLVPDVVNIDAEHLAKIRAAGEDDVHLSEASPLGVPFWSLKESASEKARLQRIEEGKPGSACPKGFLVSNTDYTKAPICTASRAFQKRKLNELEASELPADERAGVTEGILVKACICHDLAGGATSSTGIDKNAQTAVCCGPNTVYFSKVAQLREMVDHIYGRVHLPIHADRPHMFLKELSLHLGRLKEEAAKRRQDAADTSQAVRENLLGGIRHYRELAAQLAEGQREDFHTRLEKLRAELEALRPGSDS